MDNGVGVMLGTRGGGHGDAFINILRLEVPNFQSLDGKGVNPFNALGFSCLQIKLVCICFWLCVYQYQVRKRLSNFGLQVFSQKESYYN